MKKKQIERILARMEKADALYERADEVYRVIQEELERAANSAE